MTPFPFNRAVVRIALSLVCLLAVGCAPSYIVLLPNADGTVGKVVVSGSNGSHVLTSPMEAVRVAALPGNTYQATPEQVERDFGAALRASPQRPTHFQLYFQAGGAVLTPESELLLQQVIQEIDNREAPDISIIGHTDTLGDASANEALGLERAMQVRDLLSSAKLTSDNTVIESHGEKNLLIKTPDNTDEPRNRRVEITVR